MTSSRRLNMVFTRGTASKTISLANPKEDISSEQVHSLMQSIIDKEVFYYEDEDASQLDGIKRAYIREAIITELP